MAISVETTFDDSPEIKGHFVTNSSVFVKFTAVLNGNTLTITVDAENCLSYDSGKTYKTDSGYSGKVIVEHDAERCSVTPNVFVGTRKGVTRKHALAD